MKTIKSLPLFAMLALIVVAGFGATARAADAAGATDATSLLDLLTPVYHAFQGGHYAYAGALTVIALMGLLRRYAGGKFATFIHSDAGGTLATLLTAAAAACASALAAPGGHLSLSLLETALLVGVGAVGGFVALKRLAAPALQWLQARLPAPLASAMQLALFVFDKPSPTPAPAAPASTETK